jgi:hypothetical protein
MHDLYGTTKEGRLGPDGFCLYRAAIESRHPLERDLLTVGIDVLPRSLAQWEKNKLCFDRVDNEHPEESQYGEPIFGRVPVSQLQQLVADSGEVLTGEQVCYAPARSKHSIRRSLRRRRRCSSPCI